MRMNNKQEQWNRVREEIAEHLPGIFCKGYCNYFDTPRCSDTIGGHCTKQLEHADQILKIKGLLIEDEDQGLPKLRNDEMWDTEWNSKYCMFGDVCEDAQEDMLKSGFKRVIKQEDVDG